MASSRELGAATSQLVAVSAAIRAFAADVERSLPRTIVTKPD